MKPEKRTSAVSPTENTSDSETVKFPIVGIGASAGGLEALEQFLANVPENSGLAYVIIQHLDPTQKGMLPELLQRISAMEVFQVQDGMAVEPNCVYVIPPNKSMSVLNGVLYLFEPIETRGLRLPIDFFLCSLADDQQEFAVGIILSGMGADGSIGTRAIKEKNGIVLVQDPATAKFNSMPRNAIASVPADGIAPAEELPEKLILILKRMPAAKSLPEAEIKDKNALEKIILLLRTYTGNDFSLYKKNTMYRRIERRMEVHKIDEIGSYVHFLQENQKEGEILFKELMIGVTNFFRDASAWDKLKEEVVPDIISRREAGTTLRAWVPGCSTGEEAYSLAIVFKEASEKTDPNAGFWLQIFATDLDNEAIDTARKGLFPASIAAEVSPERLKRFFIAIDDGYRISSEIREMIVFAQHNIIMQPPFTKIDILSCRNLLIYLDTELQKKLFGLFYFCINPGGILMLGSSETPGLKSALFTPVDTKLKIYKRSATTSAPELQNFPASFSRARSKDADKHIAVKSNLNIQTLADQFMLEHFSSIGVLVNEAGDIIYTSGRTGKYLEPSIGKANMNIFAMLREGLRSEFPIAFRKTIKTKKTTVLQHLNVAANGNTQTINVDVQFINKPGPLNGKIMIVFTDVPESAEINSPKNMGKKTVNSSKYSNLEKELQHAREEMQNTLEEMQTSEEELKTTNEELQSTNEELQSSNEELTTSKEEMQSMNEELQTVNAELQSKIDDYSRVDNDLKNLLNSTDIATLFLDKDLNIRRFTDQATKIFKLIKSDIGRPFTDQVSDLIYPELADDALEVLRTLVFIQKQIPAKDGRWFSIRIMPYRTSDDRIDGIVITFINLSGLKQVEGKLQETQQMNRLLLDFSPDVVIKLSTGWEIQEFNPEAEKFFGKKRIEVIDRNFIKICIPEPAREETEKKLNKILDEALDQKLNMQVITAGGTLDVAEWQVNVLLNNLKKPAGTILSLKHRQKS